MDSLQCYVWVHVKEPVSGITGNAGVPNACIHCTVSQNSGFRGNWHAGSSANVRVPVMNLTYSLPQIQARIRAEVDLMLVVVLHLVHSCRCL